MTAAGKELVRRLEELGRISDEPGRLTRTFLSPAMRRANARVATWMREAGLDVDEDKVGNLIGRLGASDRRAKTLLLGSHLDTVRDAGRFDGALGVLLPIAALAELRRRRVTLPFAVEVIGFSEEEGVRFSSGYLGSKGWAGRLQARDLTLRDTDGVNLGAALRRFNGGKFRLPPPAHLRRQLLGYCEVHIEQGPVLGQRDLAVGVVTAIAGQSRGRLIFRGRAGHAGTTPMTLRHDALTGAAEFVLRVESVARAKPQLVATVGAMTVAPGAPNVIPGEVTLSLDIRHPRDRERRTALQSLLAHAKIIARRRRLSVHWQQTQSDGAVACAPKLTSLLEKSVRAVQGRSCSLISGAGHDAVVMASLAPVAMLFVRCRDGLSHHPREYSSPADIDLALRVTIKFLTEWASKR